MHTGPLAIGYRLAGRMDLADDLRLYSRAPTAAEIANLAK
jgi:hypothetical protein